MGIYLNPGNNHFAERLKSEYIDKTGMLAIINSSIGSDKCLYCVTRPRKFGKS